MVQFLLNTPTIFSSSQLPFDSCLSIMSCFCCFCCFCCSKEKRKKGKKEKRKKGKKEKRKKKKEKRKKKKEKRKKKKEKRKKKKRKVTLIALLIGSWRGYFAANKDKTAQQVLTTWDLGLSQYLPVSQDLKVSPHPPSSFCFEIKKSQAFLCDSLFEYVSSLIASASTPNQMA